MAVLLRKVRKITFPATKICDPKEFFRTREGLWISDAFRHRILSGAEPVAVPETVVVSFKLARLAKDVEIRAALPKGNVFEDASIFCAYLEDMLRRQAKGEEGNLLVSGFANVFYVREKNGAVVAVDVRRLSWSHEWRVFCCPLVDFYWYDGSRFFSCNC